MQRIAIYWKWGIWKSTISCNIAASFSKIWKKVLQVWCDPKADSTKKITWWKRITTMMEMLSESDDFVSAEEITVKWFNWIDCIEAWWPIPWTWCAWRWISKMFEVFDDVDLLEDNYDVLLFDVLWDVVCWWFASPMRLWYWEKIFIVISEEIMSMYACNNICKAVEQYKRNWIYVWWVIVNARSNSLNKDIIKQFVEKIWLDIIAFVPRSDVIACAEYKAQTVLEFDSKAEIIKTFDEMVKNIIDLKKEDKNDPRPMSDEEFDTFFRNFEVKPNWI